MIRVEELNKSYSNGFIKRVTYKALDNVSFTIHSGETLGLVGESGCGKSTLARTMLGLIPPTSGKIFFKNQEALSCKGELKKEFYGKMQIIFQHPENVLNPRMKIYKSLMEPMAIRKHNLNEKEFKSEIKNILQEVGLLEEHLSRYPNELSGGQIQRVVLARILSLKPEFIIADEPTSMLDVSVQAQVIRILKKIQLNYGISLLFISHDLELVSWMSDRIAVMYQGQIIEIAPADEFYKNPLHPYSCLLVETFTSLQHSFPAGGLLRENDNINKLCRCSYAPFCPKYGAECEKAPVMRKKSKDHYVACWKV
ncbi:ABC transporter ATP-binding protein [Anaerovorax odorimutans]|uniref:ABC transporter ATP-binding protein n=1 Tax=Anaerovorax odorimutans TaxID=109327 RepID=UPI000413EC8A|nr:ABC transporter ATP-binding protein [Anaerovorax odorimutans]